MSKRPYKRREPAADQICKGCGKEFKTFSSKADLCAKCRYKRDYQVVSSHPALSSPVVRAINLSLVQADLLSRGYSVYVSLAPTESGSLLMRNSHGLHQTVCVRTGYKLPTGAINVKRGDTNADILAIVINQDVVYEPPLDD